MTKKDIDDIISIICPNDEDFEKTCISPAYLKKELEVLALEQEPILDKIRAEIEQLPTKTRTNWDGCCPDIDYPEIEYVDVTKNKLLSIIDKYKEVDREYKESKWVKVEDELPELYREVWLSCRDYEVWLSCRGYKKVVRGYLSPDHHKSWYVYDSECGYYNINNANAWMYVERPKPYKAEREE